MKAIRLAVGVWLLLTVTQLFAAPVTLTLTELTARPVPGVSLAGLTFGFTINGKASDQTVYGASLPGSMTKVSPPALVGSAQGVLTFDLAQATDFLRFGIALNHYNALSTLSLTEAFFNRSGVQPGRAVLTFNPQVSPFALDNLNFKSVPIPEPAALILLGTGLVAIAALTKKRKKK